MVSINWSPLPKLKLFPLYSGGPVVQAGQGQGLTGDSSFYLQASQFNPAWGVNVTSGSSRTQGSNYLSLDANGGVSQRSSTELRSDYDQSIGFDGMVSGMLTKKPVPAVAPVIPNIYRDAAALLSITDANMTDLMSQPEFRIPGIGMGLKVTTDGMGGVDKVEISPSGRGMLPSLGATGDLFTLANRTEITTGMMRQPDTSFGLGGSLPKVDERSRAVQNRNSLDALALNNTLSLKKPDALNPNAGIFNLEQLGANRQPATLPTADTIQSRLRALQPPDVGLTVAGPTAAIAPEQARNLAAVQAGFDVDASARFRDNAAALASARQPESYAAAFQARAMDGRIPMAPSLPNVPSSAPQTGTGFGGMENFQANASVADAMSRRAKGGYIPFQTGGQGSHLAGSGGFGSATTSGGQTFTGQGFQGFHTGANPFSAGAHSFGSSMQGGSRQQIRPPRKPLAFMA